MESQKSQVNMLIPHYALINILIAHYALINVNTVLCTN